jgi:hypothetical protein
MVIHSGAASWMAGLRPGSRPVGVALKDLGWHRLKDVGRPGQIFQLQAQGLSAAFRCGRRATRRC